MRLIFIGPPGGGKGTQAKLLAERRGLVHLSTGDIFREAISKGTPEGKKAQAYVAAGQLVPDDLVNDIVFARFLSPQPPVRFVLDGYPRNLSQAQAFEEALRRLDFKIDAVIHLHAPDDEIVKRVGARWNCPNPACQATYNTISKPPAVPGICDCCGTALAQREDDKPETVRRRLKLYHETADDLIAHYRRQGLVKDVPGVGDIETIHWAIVATLDKS